MNALVAFVFSVATATEVDPTASPSPSDPPAEPPPRRPNPMWVVMPAVGYDSDDGLGFGARLELDWYQPGYDPYQLALVIHGYASTHGYHHHRVRFDAPGLGKHGRARLAGHFAFRQWLNDGYWGLGNTTTVDRATLGTTDEALAKRYRYTLVQPFGRLTLREEMGGPWAWFVFLSGRYSEVRTYEGSLLAEELPFGMEGGPSVQVGAGLLYDTREPELTPDRGVLVEWAGRVTPPLPGVPGQWVAAFASVRGFVGMGPGVVFGSRLMGEYAWGEIPFYDYITWGGLVPTVGFGGSETLRGVSFGRWRGPGKLLSNSELRVDVGTHTFLRREIRWQAVPFLDLGTIFGGVDADGDGEVDVVDDSGHFPVHPGLGFGLHPIVEKTFAGRFDAAMGMEMVREPDGTVVYEPNAGFYVVFERVF